MKMKQLFLWCLIQLSSSLFLIVQGKLISCVCTTDPCLNQQTSTCNTTSMCFSQYLDRGDGNNPVVKGCITTKTPLLCENRRPAVHHAKWPILVCCSKNMCNQDVEPTPLTGGGAAVVKGGGMSPTTTKTPSTTTQVGGGSDVHSTDIDHSKTRSNVLSSVYVLVLVAGLCSLLVIGGIAVLVLKRQSNNLYDQEFAGAVRRNGYLKGQTVEIASAEIQPKIIGRTYDNKLVLST